MLAPAPVIDTQDENTAFHQFEIQGATVPDDDDDDDDDDFGVPPPPPHSHDHEARSSSAVPVAPPAVDPALAAILQTLTQQQTLMVSEQARLQLSKLVRQRSSSRCPRECSRCFRRFRTGRILCSSSFFRTRLRTGHS